MHQNHRQRVGVLFGGPSAEHGVSVASGCSVIAHLDKKKYDVIPIGIDKTGMWHKLSPQTLEYVREKKEILDVGQLPLFQKTSLTSFSLPHLRSAFDVLFPVLHGPFGEDGSIQGIAKLAQLPIVGSDILGSAICMDKQIMKRLLDYAGIPIARFRSLRSCDPFDVDEVIDHLGLPLFVKPANLGSSIGISKVCDRKHLDTAVEKAFLFDEKVLIEEAIFGRELECSVLGHRHPKASLPGEILPQEEFYTYQAKYLSQSRALFALPACLSKKKTKQLQQLAIQAFEQLQCSGMARVDFFLQENTETLIVNEVNTIPGFTQISLYPKLWALSGLPYSELLDRLIELACERFREERRPHKSSCVSRQTSSSSHSL